jgi:hypothetical protein
VCKFAPSHRGTPQSRDGQHEHGSLSCIVAFLGETNWSRSKVGRILEAANNLDPFVVSKVAPIGATHPSRTQTLSTKAASERSALSRRFSCVADCLRTANLRPAGESAFYESIQLAEELMRRIDARWPRDRIPGKM